MEKLLILGGTNFIGRRLVEEVISQNKFELTLFNRGITNKALHQKIRTLEGDRNSEDVKKVMEEEWDYIIDLSCYFPNSLQVICEAIKSKPKRYIFISSCSVYDNDKYVEILRGEDSPILSCSAEQRINPDDSTYGNRKAECERILKQSNIPHTILRPALVYGKYDSTDRFYYWLYQVYNNETLLLPEKGERKFSTTYVEDLVNSILFSVSESDQSTTYNVTTTPQTSILKIVNTASYLLKKFPRLINADLNTLNDYKIQQWSGMPLWINGDHFTYSNDELKKAFSFIPSPFETSVQQTIKFYSEAGWQIPVFGISEQKRKELLLILSGK